MRSTATGTALVASLLAASAAGLSAAQSGGSIYAASQASAGSRIYAASCASCHGERLEGGVGPALSGANLRTLAKNTKLTVGDLFQFMALQMPLNQPASLKHEQYAQIMAYILKFNGYPAGARALTYDGAMKSTALMTSHK